MPNAIYIDKGTELLINGEAGANVAFSVEGLTTSNGRVSAQIDLGAAPRPSEFEWSCEVQWQATPTQGLGLALYAAGAPDSDATQIDGDVGSTDAALGDADMRRNLKYIGYVASENAAASEICVASGVFRHTMRYLSIVAFNEAGATVNATDSNFKFLLRPIFSEVQ